MTTTAPTTDAPSPAIISTEAHPRTKSALYALAERELEKATGELWDAEQKADSTPEHVELLRTVRNMREAEFMIIAYTESMKRYVGDYNKALAAYHAAQS